MCGETAIVPWEERPKAWLRDDRCRAILTAHGRDIPPWEKGAFKKFIRKRYWIYFVQDIAGGPIKIGRAIDIAARLNGLQTSYPGELVVVGLITSFTGLTEHAVHVALAEYRMRGEWFAASPAVVEYILRYRSQHHLEHDPIVDGASSKVTNV